jgi:hypothetical protein
MSGEVLDGQLYGSCAPRCTQAQAAVVVQRWVIGAALMGVGGAVSLTALLWPAPATAEPRSVPALAARVSVHPGWVGLEVAF